jgi:hypothetical protein
MAVVERNRPKKLFRAKIAFGPYSKGAVLQPTGIYRDTLLRKGFIEEVKDEAPAGKAVGGGDLVNRMIPDEAVANRAPARGGRGR